MPADVSLFFVSCNTQLPVEVKRAQALLQMIEAQADLDKHTAMFDAKEKEFHDISLKTEQVCRAQV